MERSQVFSSAQIESFREAGKILRDCLAFVSRGAKPGVTTLALDEIAEEFILSRKGVPAFKGYSNYPATLCTSVNDEIVHAIPRKRELKDGDILSIDCGVKVDGLYTDACITIPVGSVPADVARFLAITKGTLDAVLAEVVKAGVRVGTISAFIQQHLESAGFSPVEQLTGHGLGTTLHQFPNIPNIGRAGTGPVLPAHTVVAIEPIATMGSPSVSQDEDLWTLRTADGSLSCHFEHTVLVTKEGCEVLSG